MDGQKIADWEPKFRASVTSIDEGAAIRLLPAYLNRGKLEERVVLEAIQKETLNAAFTLLKARLDPPADIYEATNRFRQLVWPVGEQVYDFFARYLEEGLRAGLTTRQICVFMITQLPMEARPQAKEWVNGKEGEWVEGDGILFAVRIREIFLLKGLHLIAGYRDRGQEKVSKIQSPSQEPPAVTVTPTESEEISPQNVQVVGREPVFSRKGNISQQRWSGACYICQEIGHGYRNCPKQLCPICGQQGHRAWDCPRSRSRRGRKQMDWRRRDERGGPVLLVGPGEDAVTIQVRVGHEEVCAMLDTGARPSVIDLNTAQNLGIDGDIIKVPSKVYGLCDSPVDVIGYVDAEICVGTRPPIVQRLQVLTSDNPVLILGRGFMRHFKEVAFDFERGRIKLGSGWEPVQAAISGSTPLARAESSVDQVREGSMVTPAAALLNPQLRTDEMEQVQQLLSEFPTLFAKDPKRPSRVSMNEAHCINLETGTPVKARPRRIPPSWEEEIAKQVGEMCTNGICRPSKSPWGSDVVLVRKKDGQMRFAIDYRQLNAITKKDAYGPPNPLSILDKLGGCRYFSCLDVASAYWTVPMRKSDIEKTAFHTPRGLFEMLVMPFGMVNSGATFQRMIDRTFQGVKAAESYVDDILVFSKSFSEHIQHLRQVFERLRDRNIQLRKDKCRLAYSECEFLGHHVSYEGRKPILSYLEKVKSFPRPKTVRELQRFLGTVNYYRCYLPKMSEMATPLYLLTEKGARWEWNPECERSFEDLRRKLVEEPVVLAFPDWKKTFYVEADASAMGVGAVLSQEDSDANTLRPICYYSSSLSPTQKNYSAGQLEAWALVSAARKWSVYLRAATEVVFVTDHCPLQWLRAQKDPRHTYARWILELEELPYRIVYRPGGLNKTADYLSRSPSMLHDSEVEDEAGFEDRVYSLETPNNILKRVLCKQKKDPVIQRTIHQIRTGGVAGTGQFKKVAKRLRLVEDSLYFDQRLVIPTDMKKEILRKVHSQGHFGLVGTLEALRRSYFWHKMARDAKLYCRACVICQRVKPSHLPKEPIEPMILGKDYPGAAVGVDIGTLPWGDGEYRYFLVMVDLFTRLVELMPLHDQSAESVIAAFEQGWVYAGHGVPEIVITDQGSQLDGSAFRNFCKPLGIDKRHTTPYHPQCDGMAERNVGFVKQVILCLMLDRQLKKGSWPSLLKEASFHCNTMSNASSKVSPFELTYGRQPRSPVDMWCRNLSATCQNSHGEYLDCLKNTQSKLQALAKENIDRGLSAARESLNARRTCSTVQKGDYVMLRNCARHDALDPKYDGPFEVLARSGPDVKIKIRRSNQTVSSYQMRERTKWVHLNRCKIYRGDSHIVVRPSSSDVLPEDLPEEVGISGEGGQENSQDSESRGEQPSQLTLCDKDGAEVRAGESMDGPVYSESESGRRYPSRVRKPKQYYGEFVSWDQMSKRNKERTTSANEGQNRPGNGRD